MGHYHRAIKVRANQLIAAFFDQHYPRDRCPGTEVCEKNIGTLDIAFLEYWRRLDARHNESCRSRLHNAECLECDALLRLRPHPIYGTSEQFYRRLRAVGRFEVLGRMTLRLAVIRSQ